MRFVSIRNAILHIRQRWQEDPLSTLIPLLMFLVNAFLLHATFFTSFSDINPWDEASYMHSGMVLFEEGGLPQYASSPLTILFFGLTYFPFRSSPLWMVLSSSLSRFILFALMWLAAYRVARQVKHLVPIPVTMGFMFITTITTRTMRFPSDPLFASLAGISFSFLLQYHREHKLRSLLWASLMLGLAALARNDGLVLFPILVVLSLVAALRAGQFLPALIRILTPFLLVIGGYTGIYALSTGEFELGTAARTYDAFEAGHLIIMEGIGEGEPVLQAAEAARAVYGTPEENQYNIFNAIRRAPEVYLQRIIAVLRATPMEFLVAYSRLAYLLPLLIIRGLLTLLRRKETLLALIFFAWPTHLITSLLTTIIRQGHLTFPYYAAFTLSAIGLWALLEDLYRRPEQWVWRVGLMAILLYAILDNHPSTGLVYALFWLLLEMVMLVQHSRTQPQIPITLLLLLVFGILLRGSYPQPGLPSFGQEPQEQALVLAAERLEPGETVASWSPGFAWAARTTFISLSDPDTPTGRSPEGFLQWLQSQGVGLIYIDSALIRQSPTVWELLQAAPEESLARIYSSSDGTIQLLEMVRAE